MPILDKTSITQVPVEASVIPPKQSVIPNNKLFRLL